MDDRGANIDVLFRNGLKDLEVLPPPEVWDNIQPVVRKHQQPFIFLRSAAMIAVVLSLSFLAYRLGRQISSEVAGNNVILNSGPENGIMNVTGSYLLKLKSTSEGRIFLSDVLVPESRKEESFTQESDKEEPENAVYNESAAEITIGDLMFSKNTGLAVRNIKTAGSRTIVAEPVSFDPAIAAKNLSKRWTIAALVSPTYYSTSISGNNTVAENLMADEQTRISYAGGVALSYKINKRFSIQSGLYYSSFGQELTGISSFGGFSNYDYTKGDRNFEVLTSSGTVYTSNADVFLTNPTSPDKIMTRITSDVFDPGKANLSYIDNSLRQNFSYLELPVVLRYKIIDKGIDFNITGGFSSNVLVGNSVYATVNSGKYPVGKTDGINPVTFSSSIGMGMEYNLSKNISFNLEPTLKYYLNSFGDIPGMKIHPYSFGIFSGLSYKF